MAPSPVSQPGYTHERTSPCTEEEFLKGREGRERKVHGTKQLNFDPNAFLLLVYINDNAFRAHQNDRHHTKCVVVVCLNGDAIIIIINTLCLSTNKGSGPLCTFTVRAGDVYALTGDALRMHFHHVEPCADFGGNRVAWTIRHTELGVKTQKGHWVLGIS